MKIHLHLVSLPMYDPLQPSAQVGCLCAYVERVLGDEVSVHAYPAHLDVLLAWKGAEMRAAFADHRLFGEELFFLVCLVHEPALFEQAYVGYLRSRLPTMHASREEIRTLAGALRAWVHDRLMPALAEDGLHVVGFTTTFAQVFASVFVARELRACAPSRPLVVFGGTSMSVPEVRSALNTWGIEGLVVQGSGEVPIEALLRACLELATPDAQLALDHVDARQIVNIDRIGARARPLDLSLPRDFLASLGDPEYADYFERLRTLCSDPSVHAGVLDLVALPLEGSRGCFARCDFCQNPAITTQFRTLGGQAVAERALRVADRYDVHRVYFTDSVCNTWAEAYAERVCARGRTLDAFMEMRVHAGEAFFTRLALSGVSEMQLGVEAVSRPLLRAMAKGTTPWQNLRAVKYLAELGVKCSSNLITHHPRSTVADVEETRRVVDHLDHLAPFSLSRFVLSYGSPLYWALSAERRAALQVGFDWLPAHLRPLSTVRDLAYPYPDDWLSPDLVEAWDELRQWMRSRESHSERPTLTVTRAEGHFRVEDGRRTVVHRLVGAEAAVLDACHAAPSIRRLPMVVGLPPADVDRALANLVARDLVLLVDAHALALPLRPRAELIDALAKHASSSPDSPAPSLSHA